MTEGLHELKRRVVLEPENQAARFALAEALFGEKRYGEAATQLESALAADPGELNTRRLLARTYVAEGRHVPAERTLREGIKLRPELVDLRDALAEVMESLGRPDDALLQLEEATRIDKDDVGRLAHMADLFVQRRLLDRARATLEHALGLHPERDDLKTRLREVVSELGGTPDRPESPLDRGGEYLLGRTREALETSPLKAATADGPLREVAVALRLGDLRAARRGLVLAGDASPFTTLVHFLRGEVLLAEGEREKAEAAYKRCLVDPSAPLVASERLGELLLARESHEEAACAFARGAEGAPVSLGALIGLGDARYALGQRDEAAAAYEKALAREPGGPAAARVAMIRARSRTAEDESRPVGRIGVLGWNPSGGLVSPVEAVAVPGKGELIFSGNVGTTGQEAAKVAYSCLKARAEELGIQSQVLRHDLHLHFADTEMAKDGPSSGLALLLAGLSALTRRPLRPALAATGEVTLHGGVKAVGGLHEKLVAACLAGVRTVLVPRKNLLDARALPPEVTSRVGLVFVDSLGEAVGSAFLPRDTSEKPR